MAEQVHVPWGQMYVPALRTIRVKARYTFKAEVLQHWLNNWLIDHDHKCDGIQVERNGQHFNITYAVRPDGVDDDTLVGAISAAESDVDAYHRVRRAGRLIGQEV